MSGEVLCRDDLVEYVMATHYVCILGYSVDYGAQEMRISTERQGKRLEFRFEELLAHHFDHAGSRNVIYDIVSVPLGDFINAEQKQLSHALRYGFPAPVGGGLDELQRSLTEQGYRVFEIRASVGLYGYVIAKRLVIEPSQPSGTA